MKDLQAMDRAHRIGQKKVVNVYRLITRSTLEEKIMKYVSKTIKLKPLPDTLFNIYVYHFSFQKFKLKTANTVISSENSSLQTMGTDKVMLNILFQNTKIY